MPGIDIGVTDTTQASGIIGVDASLRPSSDESTTITADPSTGGTTLAVTSASRFPSGSNYYVRVDDEYMLVTAGAGTTSWTVTRAQFGSTAAAHSIGATAFLMVAAQRVVPIRDDMILFDGLVAGFRTLGNAATTQSLFSIENGAGSTVLVKVKRLTIKTETAASTANLVTPDILATRPTALPTAGTTMTKGGQDTALTSNASVQIRSATGSDGGTATVIATAVAGTARLGHAFPSKQVTTSVGQIIHDDLNLLPSLVENDPVILRANQAILVTLTAAAAANNPASNHYVLSVAWEEIKTP
jgi:hypothetical protein